MSDMSPEAKTAVRRIEKLFKLAAKAGTPEEAAAATAKAQELLLTYNLDMSVIDQDSGGQSTKRTDEKMKGGLYVWQRQLWEAVAELNFCMHWTNRVHHPTKRSTYVNKWGVRSSSPKWVFQHRLVGRTVNVTMTRTMCEYLEQTIERLTRERVADPKEYFTKWAVSYREGIAEAVISKIYRRRAEILDKERQDKRAQEEMMAKAGMSGASSSTALTLAGLAKSEEDANNDFLYGEGYSAKRAAKRAEWAEQRRREEAEHTAWAAANPEEAAAQAEENRKNERKRPWNYGTGSGRAGREKDWGAYHSGHEVGKNVSIDPQTDRAKPAGLLK